MKKYVIKKKNKNKKISKFNYIEEGYCFKPKLIKISSLHIMNQVVSNPLIKRKLDRSFRKLAAILFSVLHDEDTTDGDCIIALDEIAKEKSKINKEFTQYLKKEEQEKYLKRLKILEQEAKEKLVDIRLQEEKQMEVLEKEKSR